MIYPIWIRNGKNWNRYSCGFITGTGEITVDPIYDDALYCWEGLAGFNQRGKWGFIASNGDVVVEPRYKRIHSFSEGVAGVSTDELKWGFIHRSGEYAISETFSKVNNFREGMAAVMKEERWGFVGHSGQVAIEGRFADAVSFYEGVARVSVDGRKYGFIDLSGAWQIPPRFEPNPAHRFAEGLTVQATSRKEVLHFDRGGRGVFEKSYTAALSFTEGYGAVKAGDKWGFIDHWANLVIPPRFTFVRSFSQGLAAAELDGRAGFINPEGKWTIEVSPNCRCDTFVGELALCKDAKADRMFYINRTGKCVWEGKYCGVSPSAYEPPWQFK